MSVSGSYTVTQILSFWQKLHPQASPVVVIMETSAANVIEIKLPLVY